VSGDLWYVEVKCAGYTIAPAGQSQHRMEVQFKVGVPEGGTWDPANDPSYATGTVLNRNVPLYEGTTLLWGQVPASVTPSPTVSQSPSASPSPSSSPSVSPSVSPSTSPQPAAACRVAYSANDWGGGFTGAVTVTNSSAAAWSAWALRFAFPGSQQVSQGWSGVWSQSGNQVTVTNQSWNGAVPAGGSVSLGFNGTHSGSNPAPAAFTVNGTACVAG
jgi:hypothetical protein